MNISALPPEVLEKIFLEPAVKAKDLSSLCQACNLFREVINSNALWRVKFQHRWPDIYYEIERKGLGNQANGDWKGIYQQRILVKNSVLKRLSEMACDTRRGYIKYQKALNEALFYNFVKILPEEVNKTFQLLFIIDELQEILLEGSTWTYLTVKYYAEKSLWYVRHLNMLPDIKQFMAADADQQDIEVGTTIIAQWFQPKESIRVTDIKSQLDSLAKSAKEMLMTINPDHLLFSLKDEIVSENVHTSLWRPDKCREILQAIEMVVKPTFNQGFSTYFTPSNSYINLVLKRKQGIPITLCFTVMCVARRLGCVLEPVNFPHHFILRWMEFPGKVGIDRYTFVDVFSGNYSLKFDELGDRFTMQHVPIVESHCDRCTNQEVLRRMLRNLLNLGRQQRSDTGLDLLGYSIELSNLFMPNELELVILSAQVSLHLKVNIVRAAERIEMMKAFGNFAEHAVLLDLQRQCETMLQHLEKSQEEDNKQDKVKFRSQYPEVQYSVGMVMKHKKYDYLCVIRGWDAQCQASEQWISQMGVDRCERGRNQPFYNVWVWDGSDRYAAEENLVFTKDAQPIAHHEVGRLFESFTGQFYVPGALLMANYPDDFEFTRTKVTDFFSETGAKHQ